MDNNPGFSFNGHTYDLVDFDAAVIALKIALIDEIFGILNNDIVIFGVTRREWSNAAKMGGIIVIYTFNRELCIFKDKSGSYIYFYVGKDLLDLVTIRRKHR